MKFTDKMLSDCSHMRADGMAFKDIARLLGVEINSLRAAYSRYNRKDDKNVDATATNKSLDTAPIKKSSLSDFTPREMIKHLYSLGYRIENNSLYVITKQKVNINSVLNE